MDLTIEKQEQSEKWFKLNVRPQDHARFKVLAAQYQMQMADLFSKCVDALEANMAEAATRKAEETEWQRVRQAEH